MKSNIKHLIVAGGALLALASCSENSWNDKYLNGFEGGYTPTDVQTVKYTLTANDYARLADNRFNKLLASQEGVSSELAAVKSQCYLNSAIPAEQYIPNLLKDSLFKYFTLSDGSAINLTYQEAGELPEIMAALNGATEYIVSDEDYQKVYDSETDYTASFSPSNPASKNIPSILAEGITGAKAGDYVVVNYNNSDVDPVFSTPDVPPTSEFTLSNVLTSSLTAGTDITVNGVVTAVCNAGIILTDQAGSILVYASKFPVAEYNVGDQVVATGVTSSYKNCLQIPYDDNLQKVGTQAYTYPAAVSLTPDYLLAADANTDPVLAVYGVMTGKVDISGNYYNVYFGDRTDVRGSLYNVPDNIKALLTNGETYDIEGYFTQTSKSGATVNANFVVTAVKAPATKGARKATRSVVVPSINLNSVYVYNGSKWAPADNSIFAVNPEDYAAMGLTHGNFSGTQATEFIPRLLANKFPYATADTEKYVVYKYFANGSTTFACAQYTYNGSEWADTFSQEGVHTVTSQFVKANGVWRLDPSVTLTLPAGRNQPLSTWFFQACVDWIRDNVPNGAAYITSYGNNEYYCGTSAYQGNVDLRAGSARNQYGEGYEGMSDEEIVDLMKKRFANEVCPGTLSVLYPDLAPIGTMEPTVTINFFYYTGTSTKPAQVIYKVVAKATFELVEINWDVEE
ncbi:MAG: hypothetical protein K2N88_08855 [Muribaculaceae bacterium]|nr:hypothetical protein [Muribaculaceae bacterium]